MSKKFAVILAGCGAQDGSEIHEATLAMYAIAKNGGSYALFAPDAPQHEVIDHLTGQPVHEKRNILTESARIARGNINPLNQLNVSEYDVVFFPGGFGAAKNLFTYAFEGMGFSVLPEVQRVVEEAHASKKIIGAMCISPVMIAKILGKHKVIVTVGPAEELGRQLEDHFGAVVEKAAPGGAVTDNGNRVVTTPAYMYDSTIREVGEGADAAVKAIMSL